MAPQPRSLADLVRGGTFRARTQHRLIGEEQDLPWPAFAIIQRRYRAAADNEDRRLVAREFERLVKSAHEEAQRREADLGCACPGCSEGLEPFTVDHFRAWAAGVILDDRAAWQLEPYQQAFIADVFAGYSEIWLVVPEGNGKTTTLAGLALYHCEHTLSGEVAVAASSRDQAQIMFRQAEGMVHSTPRLKGLFRAQEGHRRVKCEAMLSRIQIHAADAGTGDGIIPTLALVDELHRHKDLKLYRVWRGKLEKRGGKIATISTAGEPGSEFETTREQIRQSAADVQRKETFVRAAGESIVLHEWAVPEGGDVADIELVKRANPFSGVTLEALRRKWESPTMTVAHWRRFVCNLPTRSTIAAIQEREWHNAATADRIPAGEVIWAGMDVGWQWDTTAIIPFWWRDPHYRLLGPATILEPRRDGSQLDPNLIKHALTELAATYRLTTLLMDSSRAEDIASWIQDELDVQVVYRAQTSRPQAEDFERFMSALRQGWLHHTGDEGLRRHALNAVTRLLPDGGSKFGRVSQTRQGGDQDARVIDALAAAAMVHSHAVAEHETPPPPVCRAMGFN